MQGEYHIHLIVESHPGLVLLLISPFRAIAEWRSVERDLNRAGISQLGRYIIGEERACAAIGILLVEINGDVERVALLGTGARVDDYREGVEGSSVGEGPAGGDAEGLTDFSDGKDRGPVSGVGDGFEVEGIACLPGVGRRGILGVWFAEFDVVECYGGAGTHLER